MTGLNYRTPLSFFIICLAIVAATGYGILRYLEATLVDKTGQELAVTAVSIADKLDVLLQERYGDIQMLAHAQDFRDQNIQAMTTYLAWMTDAYPLYEWIGVTDKAGRIIAATDRETVGKDRSDREWFQSVRDQGGIHVERPLISPESRGTMAVAFTAPIYGRTGAFIGAVTSRVSVPVLERSFAHTVAALEQQWGTSPHLEYQFLARNGSLIAGPSLRSEERAAVSELGLPSAHMVRSSAPGYIQERHPRWNKDVITGFAAASGAAGHDELRWGVLIHADRDDVVLPIRRTMFTIGLAGITMVLPLCGALVWSLGRLHTSVQAALAENKRAVTAEDKFRHIVDATPDAIVIIDSTGAIVLSNRQAESLFGVEPGGLLQQPLDILLPKRFRNLHREHSRRFMEHPAIRPMGGGLTLSACRRDGSEFPSEISLNHMDTAEGRFVIAAIRDVTQQKQRERELEAAKVEALASTKVQSEFLATMSHEIRTPLNAIIGTADLLWDTTLSSEQRKYLRVFRRAGDSLLGLINDLLDLSKIEAGHMELDMVAFNVEEVVDKVMEMLTMQAHDKGLEFASHIDPAVPRHLMGDPTRLTQILVNLLGNALKFTAQGSVTLHVMNDDAAHLPGAIRFTVHDTGIGIPADKLTLIFERFRQADSSKVRQYGGTGLGLAISKQLAERMQGNIRVESTVGTGSAFHCTAVFKIQSPNEVLKSPPSISLAGMRTLIVDDHPINRLILRDMLSEFHADIFEAEEGRSALHVLREAAEQGRPFHLLLLDCRMPKLDGFHVVDQLKQSALDSGLTIVMLTSDDWANDIARTYDLALGGYLIKPIRRADLIKTIGIALNRSKCLPPAPGADSVPALQADQASSLRILLADDSPDNQMLIQAYLQQTKCHIDLATDGAQAVERFTTGCYHVVIMDMHMPVMDGFAATKAIREWEKDHHLPATPIIALTALALKEEAAKSLEAGCTIHITKPIRKQTLVDLLRQTSDKLAA